MAHSITVGIIGAGWPGAAHAKAYQEAQGFKVMAVADLIPSRRKQFMSTFGVAKEFAQAREMIEHKDIDAVSVCLPNHLHAEVVIAALKAGKHVVCESPPAMDARQARRMETAAEREKRVLLYALQRRFGPHEQAARLATEKGFVGSPNFVRATWTRTRAIPVGTGWYTDRSQSGGGALIDLGVHMLDLGWSLLGQPRALTAFALTQRRFAPAASAGAVHDVEDSASAMLTFEGGKSMELAVAWAINQPPSQNGSICRVYGDSGAIEVYTPHGATLFRDFTASGQARATALKPPKTTHQTALIRHFKDCIAGKTQPLTGGGLGTALMGMVDAIYKSAETGRSVEIKVA